MPTNMRQNPADASQPSGGGAPAQEEDFLSLREMLMMVLRHRWPIAIAVLLVTVAAGIFFITRPRVYQAEGYLQVIPPVSLEGNVDKGLYETMIVSHLQRVSSAFLAKNVSTALKEQGLQIAPLTLEKQIQITRPPKTDLIRLVAANTSPDTSLLIVRQWIHQYLASIQNNNIRTALSQVYLLLKQAQATSMKDRAAVDQLQARVVQTAPLITVSRAVDDRQLWSDLARKPALDPASLKKLAGIHIKGQEQSSEYINLKITLMNAEKILSSVQAQRDFYQEVARILEEKANLNGSDKSGASAATGNKTAAESDLYVKTLLKNVEIIQFGEPGLVSASRGALKKTALVFVGILFLSCFGAFLYEWGRGMLSS